MHAAGNRTKSSGLTGNSFASLVLRINYRRAAVMANFESGVARYIHAKALVKVHFPVDFHGNAGENKSYLPYQKPWNCVLSRLFSVFFLSRRMV